MLSRWNWLS